MALPEPSYDDILKSLNSVDPYVHAFLERARKGATNKKEVLLDIHQYYFGSDETPTLRDADVAMLLSGIIAISSRRKRRIGIKMKEVAGMALKLLRKLLDPEFNAENAPQFLRVLRMIPVATLARMRLDKHILSDKGNSADALWIASKLKKTVPLLAIMENAVARSRFRTYVLEHPGEDEGSDASDDDMPSAVRADLGGPPTTWCEEDDAAPRPAGFDAAVFPARMPNGMPPPVLDGSGINEEHVDPLGLMRLDMGLLYRLRRASSMQDATRARTASTSSAPGHATTSRITLLSDQFEPELFLSIFHRHTSFADLQRGMGKLQEEMDAHEEMRVAQLKDHFDRFIDAQEAVHGLQRSIDSDNVTGRGGMLVSARKALGEVELSAGMLFQPVLERKQQADRIRSVLEVLKRFHSLFHVPGTISDSIANGNYEAVLRDYKNARVLIGSSRNAIFQRLWAEVEQRIQTLRAHLLGVLEDPQVHVDEQERVIGVLRQLASDDDPAFHYLSQQHARMLEKMNAIVAEMHSTSAAGVDPADGATAMAAAGNDAFVFPSSVSSLGGSEAGDADTMLAAHWGRCVKKLTACVQRHVPSWWKVSKKLCDTAQTRGMLKTTLQSYASKVRDAIELVGEDSVMFVVMQDVVMEVTQCMHTLEPVQLPVACITVVRSLVTHANTSYFTQAFRSIMMEARGLVDEEDWNTERSVHEVTGLCERFRTSLESAVLEMGRVLHKGSNVFALVAPIFRDCLLVFTDTLHHLAFRKPRGGMCGTRARADSDDSNASAADGSDASVGAVHHDGGGWGPFVPPLSRRLLLVYNNTMHYSSHTVHVLVGTLMRVARAKQAPASLTTDLATVHAACEHLCLLVANRYIAEHSVKARAVVRRGMRLSGVDYARGARPSELSAWVDELLRMFVLVHAELHTTTPALVPRVLGAVVEGVLQQVLECAREVRVWSKWGVVLLDAEVMVLERVLAAQLNKRSKRTGRALHALLRKRAELSDVDRARGEKLLGAALTHHALMFACFAAAQ